MKENKVGGKCYRILTDSVNDIWDRISFWTKASDVQFEDGSYLEGKTFGHCMLARSKAYKAGDICYCTNAPSWVVLKCKTAGTTAATEPTDYKNLSSAGTSVKDGTAVFEAFDLRLATSLSTSNYQAPSVGLLKSTAAKVNVYVGSDNKLHFVNSAGADSALNFKMHNGTYPFPTDKNGAQVDLGAVHKFLKIDASALYQKGKEDGVTVHTDPFNVPASSKGAVQNLGEKHNYRYVIATDVYQQGVADADARINTDSANYKSGYNAGVKASLDGNNQIAKIKYMYHHHTINNTSADSENQSSCPYADDYLSNTQAGCFKELQYTGHDHTDSCAWHYYTETHTMKASNVWTADCPDPAYPDHKYYYVSFKCDKCGATYSSDQPYAGADYGPHQHIIDQGWGMTHNHTYTDKSRIVYDCQDMPKNKTPKFCCSCGKKNGALSQMTITYK